MRRETATVFRELPSPGPQQHVQRLAYRLEELAAALGVCSANVPEDIPFVQLGPRLRIYPVADAVRWLTERAARQAAAEAIDPSK